MGAANLAPFFVRNLFSRLGIPVDVFLQHPGIFGPHKTVRGILIAPIAGTIVFLFQQLLSTNTAIADFGFFDYRSTTLWFGFFAGLGAIFGDLFRAGIKRKMGIRPGGRFFPFDQIDFLLGGMLGTLFVFQPTWFIALGVLAVGLVLHIGVNALGYALRMKEEVL